MRRQAPSTRDAGRAAEDAAARWLERAGYVVLARNHATRRGEVDLICREGATICFVEVRSRSRLDYGTPAASVTRAKALRIVGAATDWAVRNGGLEQPMRFDVVAVQLGPSGPEIQLFRSAFDASGVPSP